MKPIKICVRCNCKGKLNLHGVCKECESYDKNKNNIKTIYYDYQKK